MNTLRSVFLSLTILALLASGIFAQDKSPLYKVAFEPPKDNVDNYQGVDVKLGGDFAIQFQGLNQQADSVRLVPLGTGFNLPTANLSIKTSLAKGIQLNMDLYLSARHHNETWVKGGSLTIDQMPFLNSGPRGVMGPSSPS